MADDAWCERCGKPPWGGFSSVLDDERGSVQAWEEGCMCPPLCIYCGVNDCRPESDFCSVVCADRWEAETP